MDKKLLSLAVMLSCVAAMPAMAATVIPSTDSVIRDVQQNKPISRIEMMSKDQSKLDAPIVTTPTEPKVQVNKFVFTGQKVISQEKLQKVVQKYVGRKLNFQEMEDATLEVSKYCRLTEGYYIATAYYPEQDIQNGIVEIRVLLGEFGDVTVDNKSRLQTEKAKAFAEPLKKGELIKTRTMESVMENLNNIPGVSAKAIMKPGNVAGASDIAITLADTKKIETTVFVDNYGTRYTGRYRYGFNTYFNNDGSDGEFWNIGGMITNKDMRSYWLGYESPMGYRGSRIGISYAHQGYSLGDFYERLGATGRSNSLTIYGMTPLIQKYNSFMKLLYGISHNSLKDEYRTMRYGLRKYDDYAYVGIGGAHEDQNSYTSYTAIYYRGRTENKDLTLDGVTYHDPGGDIGMYHKGNFDVMHIDYLQPKLELVTTFHGQLANHPLDSSEKMSLGGPYAVRAYPASEACGDIGYQSSIELRFRTNEPGLTFGPFFDIGEVSLNKDFNEHRKLMGWGIGIQYMDRRGYYRPQPDWFMRLDWARKIDAEQNQSTTSQNHNQFWFRVVKLL